MRIIKEFNIGAIKCSLMFHNERYTLKMEDEGGEVNYKLGNLKSSDISQLETLLSIPEINTHLAQSFFYMRKGRDQLKSLIEGNPDEIYDEII